MNAYRALAAAVWFGSASLSAQAATLLATGGVYGGPEQHKASCQVFNAGRDVIVTTADIIAQNGTILPQLANTCNGTLFRLNTCVVASAIANDSTYACRVVIRQTSANVRGTFDLRDQSDRVLISSPLR